MPVAVSDVKVENKCIRGLHPLIEITSIDMAYDCEKVIRWCPECGAIVVDMDCDGRTYPGHYRKMMIPKMRHKSNDSKRV